MEARNASDHFQLLEEPAIVGLCARRRLRPVDDQLSTYGRVAP